MWLFDLFFLNSTNLICQGMDISQYFRESLELRDNESRLYLVFWPLHVMIIMMRNVGRLLISICEEWRLDLDRLSSSTYTVELQWLEPRWLVYHGWVEHVLKSAGISSKYDIRIIYGDFFFYLVNVCCVHCRGDSNEYTQHTFII